jgi:hypothetical protein
VVLFGAPRAQAQAPERLVLDRQAKIYFNSAGMPTGTWSNGVYMLMAASRSSGPILYQFDREGLAARNRAIDIPGVSLLGLRAWVRAADGRLVVAGSGFSKEGRTELFFSIFASDGTTEAVIPTTPFSASQIVAAADGAIWTAVAEHLWALDEMGQDPDPSHHVIRRFAADGTLLDSFVPADELVGPKWLHPAATSRLVASSNLVAWYSPSAGRYYEFTLDGVMRTYPKVAPLPYDTDPAQAPRVLGAALTDDEQFYVGAYTSKNRSEAGIYRLDKSRGEWVRMEIEPAPRWTYLYGADGNRLVTRGVGGPPMRLLWLRPE